MVDSIIILFESVSTEFGTNGLGALPDAISCIVTEERNGGYELEMEYPITGKRYSELSLRRIIVAKPNPYSDAQPFRIYAISKPINGIVTINAEHISYDLSGVPVSPFKSDSVTSAFVKMKEASTISCPFTFWTDKTTKATIEVAKPSSIRSLLGGVQGSILDIYGGEYEFDKYIVKLHNNRGSNRGVTIRYGKNLTDLKQDENCSAVYTGVYPFWYSEQDGLVTLSEKIIKAPGTYNFTRIYPLDLSQEWQDKPTENQLKERAKAYMDKNHIGVPKVSIDVSFVQLAQAEEYKEIAILETVYLCDTVNVEFPELGVSATAKCNKTVYNVLTNKYDKIELGDARSNLASTISEQSKEISNVPTKNFMEQAIENATQMITGGLGGHVVMHSSTGGQHPDEILIMDTDNIKTATKVWRWNKGGLGYSGTGYAGPYATAITADGRIVADFITAGEFDGALIKAGTICADMLDIEYKKSVTEYADNIAEKAREDANKYADNLKNAIDKEIEDVNKSVNDINTELETTVADGIITESEKASIKKILQIIAKEKGESDSKYKEIYKNSYLSGTPKTDLYNRYTAAYGTSSSSKYNRLVTAINDVINATTVSIIDSKMAVYRTVYTEYGNAVAAYQEAIEVATAFIANAYAKEKADDMGATVTKEMTTLIENTADSIRLLCKAIEEENMHNYVFGGNFTNGFTDEWYTSSADNRVVTDQTLGVCAKVVKTSSNNSYIRCRLGVLPAGTYRVRYKAATASGYESTARVQCTAMSSYEITKAGLLKSTEFTTIERDITITSSTYTRYIYFYAYVQDAPIYIKDVEVLGQMSVYTEAQFKVNSDSITAEVTRAKNEETELKASIKVNTEAIKLKVSSSDVESIIEQKADSIRLKASKISWESTYSSMTSNGTLTCQNATIKGTLYSENGNDKVYLRNGRMRIYYNNVELGLIGGNGFEGYSDKEGLNFDLEDSGDYMTWAAQDAGGGSYKTKWTYARSAFASYSAGMLNAGCDIDMHYWKLRNVSWPDGSISATMNFVQVLQVNSDGTVQRWGSDAMMRFKNGILIDLSYYSK